MVRINLRLTLIRLNLKLYGFRELDFNILAAIAYCGVIQSDSVSFYIKANFFVKNIPAIKKPTNIHMR
jgi:hypothetical protein